MNESTLNASTQQTSSKRLTVIEVLAARGAPVGLFFIILLAMQQCQAEDIGRAKSAAEAANRNAKAAERRAATLERKVETLESSAQRLREQVAALRDRVDTLRAQ